ncbi:MAG: hypothetical protein AAFV46_07645, partial [Cyanobacteria bacterium J06635_11]
MKLKRPILVGGLGLSASLWLLNILGHSPIGHAFGDGSTLIGAIGVGAGLWWIKQRGSTGELVATPPLAIGPVDKAAIENVIAGIETTLTTLTDELSEAAKADKSLPIWTKIEAQRDAIAQLLTHLDRDTLSLAVVGNKATGKTTLISHLNNTWKSDHAAVANITEVPGEDALPALDADLVLFVTAADLTQSELG